MIVRNDPLGGGKNRSVPLTLETSAAASARPVRSDMDPRLQRIVAMRRHVGLEAHNRGIFAEVVERQSNHERLGAGQSIGSSSSATES